MSEIAKPFQLRAVKIDGLVVLAAQPLGEDTADVQPLVVVMDTSDETRPFQVGLDKPVPISRASLV